MSRCGLISTGSLATCGLASRSPALLIVPYHEIAQRGRSDRDPRVLGKDVVGSLQHRAVDGPHELSSLDVTVELQHAEECITAA